MGIEGSVVGGGGVSLEILQLIAADPAEFQRRMALIEQAKQDFEDQLKKNQIVGDILALRREAAAAVDVANEKLEKAKEDAKRLISTANSKVDKMVSTAQVNADDIIAKAEAHAANTVEAAKKIMDAANTAAANIADREREALQMKSDAEEKYRSVEPDRLEYQKQAAAAQKAAAASADAKADYDAQRAVLEKVAQQLAKVLNAG